MSAFFFATMNTFLFIQAYLYVRHLILAKSKYYIHSPFVFKFYENVLRGNNNIDTSNIKRLRQELLIDKRIIDFKEYGAGSKVFSNGKRKVSDIVKHNAVSSKQGIFLTKLVRFINPENILEFGTSLGFSSIYMALGKDENSHIYTMEGDNMLCSIAAENFKKAGTSNITILNDEFDISINNIKRKRLCI